jgi:hypothetical protein
MAERIAGIKGYIGELIVREWLKHRYNLPNYSIKTQIRPQNVNPRGGPYLDLCVLKGDEIIEVYETKTQDYRISQINKSLSYLWKKEKGINGCFFGENVRETAYIQGTNEEKPFSPNIKAYLITMCPIYDELAKYNTPQKLDSGI